MEESAAAERWRIRFTDGKVVEVVIWAGREGYEAALAGAPAEDLRDGYACFKASRVRENGRKVGEIHLVKGNYGVGVIAHDCLHAVFHWLMFRTVEEIQEIEEEELCVQLGVIVKEFWIKHYAKNKKENRAIIQLQAAN